MLFLIRSYLFKNPTQIRMLLLIICKTFSPCILWSLTLVSTGGVRWTSSYGAFRGKMKENGSISMYAGSELLLISNSWIIPSDNKLRNRPGTSGLWNEETGDGLILVCGITFGLNFGAQGTAEWQVAQRLNATGPISAGAVISCVHVSCQFNMSLSQTLTLNLLKVTLNMDSSISYCTGINAM